jgi:peptidoglycan/xylan/chitin deacetylase (PgdA/CDA1 family)
VSRAADGVPILIYHEVSAVQPPTFRKYTVTPRAFAAQMHWLALAGYTPISLDALLAHRERGSALPRRPVVITFDDGFQGSYEHAAPVLRAHGFTATFYLVAGLMGQPSRWLLRERGLELPIMSWSAARELQASGFTCAAHTLTHARLAALTADECGHELRRSREMLEDELGRPVTHLAYPFGTYSEETKAIAEEIGYRSAVSGRIGVSDARDDVLALRRVPISGEEGLADFICRVRTAHRLRDVLRRRSA